MSNLSSFAPQSQFSSQGAALLGDGDMLRNFVEQQSMALESGMRAEHEAGMDFDEPFTQETTLGTGFENNSYQVGLQSIYDFGKANQDRPLNAELAEFAIEALGVDLGKYAPVLAKEITGMTAVEAHIYLLEVLGTLDKSDGSPDNAIDIEPENLTQAFSDAGLGDNTLEVAGKLSETAQEFKEFDDPSDAANIEFLQSLNGGSPETLSEEAKEAALQQGNLTDGLGLTDPSLGNQQEQLELLYKLLDSLFGSIIPGFSPPLGLGSSQEENMIIPTPRGGFGDRFLG